MSDTFDMKEVDGVVYEVETKKISRGGEVIGSCPLWPSKLEKGPIELPEPRWRSSGANILAKCRRVS